MHVQGLMPRTERPRLASYAMAVEKTLGRRCPEPAHPYRNDYERARG
jgi:hypothetical protein